jgi:hypothetical protein
MFRAWAKVQPYQNALTDALVKAPIHIIATMRVKTEYSRETDANGKTVIKKIGLAPVQKEGMEYEFDILADITPDNTLIVSKTRCPELNEYAQNKAGKETAEIILRWLTDGVDAPAAADEPAQEAKPAKAKMRLETKPANKKPAAAAAKPAAGIFEEQGVLKDILKKEEEGGPVYGFVLEGNKIGFRSCSGQMVQRGREMLGKEVRAKVLAGPNGYALIGLELA